MQSDILTLDEAAALLSCSIETIRRHLVNKQLPGRKIGKTWYLSRSQIEAFIRGELVMPRSPKRKIAGAQSSEDQPATPPPPTADSKQSAKPAKPPPPRREDQPVGQLPSFDGIQVKLSPSGKEPARKIVKQLAAKGMKYCKQCQKILSLDKFYGDSANILTGKMSLCSDCFDSNRGR